ncbi:MAG: hypothetical protein R3D68_11790 [Hyphomicrobiaceae bacterium]
MRAKVIFVAALGLSVLTGPRAMADEIFLCEDGRLLYVNAKNRKIMRDDPCVKAWFDRSAKPTQARVDASAGSLVEPQSKTPPPSRTPPPSAGSSARPATPPSLTQR